MKKERERRDRRISAEYADGLGMWRRRQLRCLRHDSRPINKLKYASKHRVIAPETGVDDTCLIASALSARSLRTLRSKIKATYFRNPKIYCSRWSL